MSSTFSRSCSALAALATGVLLSVFVVVPVAHAEDAEDVITARLNEAVPGLRIESVSESVIPGLYEVQTNNRNMIYATEDGEYVLAGELLQLKGNQVVNVTEQARSGERLEIMSAYSGESAITYKAEGEEKAVVNVFTDIDCAYCRKLHDEMDQINGLGITVNYYAFPRSGPNTPSFFKYESVWCSADQQDAMNRAKAGEQIEQTTCDNPVQEQFELGQKVGVNATPTILLEDGSVVRGYMPADKLAEGLGVL